MKKTRRLLSLILVLVMLCSTLPRTAFAFTNGDTTAFTVTNTTVALDGTKDENVTISFVSTSADTYFMFEGIFSLVDRSNTIKLSAITPHYTVGTNDNYVNLNTGKFAYMDSNLSTGIEFAENASIVTATYTIPADTAPGKYYVDITEVLAMDANSNEIDSATYTAEIIVTEAEEEKAPYEIYYELDKDTDSDTDSYKDYDIGENVTATIYLVNNTDASVTLQAYDIYLTYADSLKFSSSAMTGATALAANSNTAATAGEKVTHIEAVGDTYEAVELAVGSPISLGTIVFAIDEGVKHGEQLPITLTKDTTNISIALTETVEESGDTNAYYPSVIGDDLGAEVTTTYTVSYDANGGTGAPDAQTKEYNKDLILSETKPNRGGYEFLGWATTADATNATYQAGRSYTENGDATLYAVWKQTTFTVKWYNAEGTEIYSETVNSGDKATFDDTSYTKPAKEADAQYTYTFIGWNTDANAENALNDLTITADTDFYPIFSTTTNTYTVSWKNEDGTELEKDENVPYGATPVYDSATPTKAATVQYTYTFAGWSPEISTVIGDVTYTATYTEKTNSYTVTYAAGDHGVFDDGTTTVTETVEYGGFPTTVPTVTANAGYTFDGWYDTEGNKVEDVSKYTINGNVTLTAKYTANTYTVKFVANGGSGTMEDKTYTYDVSYILPANAFTKTGYKFDGWKLGDATYSDGQNVTNLATSGTVTLVAQWAENPFDVKIDTVENGTVSVDNNSAKEGDTISVTVTPTPGYEIETVTYTPDGGTANPINPTDGVYSFSMPDANVTVSATFKAIDYTVDVDSDSISNGTVSADKTTANVGDTVTLTADPDEGYKLKGYTVTDDANGSVIVTDGTFTMPASNVTVTAEFEAISYSIEFDKNAEDATGTMNSIDNVKYDADQTLTANVFTRNGYNFAGWNTKKNGSGTTYADEESVKNLTTTDEATVTLYAQWTAATYEVKLNTNEGTINSGNVTAYTYGTGATLPTDVTKTGYDFAGWYNNEALTGDAVTSIGTEEYGDKEYWAKWTPSTYKVTLEANEGTIAEGKDITEYTHGTAVTLPTGTEVTKPGYTFAGWYDNETFTGTPVKEIAVESTGDKIFYANWTPASYTITFELDEGTLAEGAANPMTYTIESTDTLPTATKEYYTFAGWKVKEAVGNWSADAKIAAGTAVTGYYGDVTLVAQWNRKVTPAVEEYKYAYTNYWMLRVDASDLEAGKEYQFNGDSMYYTTDSNYLVETGDTGVFYTLISADYVTDGALNDAGYKLLTIADCTSRATIAYNGKINDDAVVNIADANVVYQMVVNGGDYYGEGQLNTEQRLAADMNTATKTDNDHRASIADVHAIVDIINGVTNP